MGWVVYDASYGTLIKYYNKIGPAKAAVTRNKKEVQLYSWSRERRWCSYKEYEGILMGLRDAEFDMWRFLNGKK